MVEEKKDWTQTSTVTNEMLESFSLCFEPHTNYSLPGFDGFSPAQCFNQQPYTYPSSCVNQSDLVFIDGIFSADRTFYNCLNKVDQSSMPIFYNGRYNGCVMMYTTVTMLNLVNVRKHSAAFIN